MTRKLTQEEMLKKFKKAHGKKYDYSKAVNHGCDTKTTIICRKHGPFQQTPYEHAKGKGCKQCAVETTGKKLALTTEEFIKKARKVHGKRYGYDKVRYKNNNTAVKITCKKHGDFLMSPNRHMSGANCRKCTSESTANTQRHTTEMFVLDSLAVHGSRYTYDRTKYVNNTTKVIITCPKHGDFKQDPSCHKQGAGCPICRYPIKFKVKTSKTVKRSKKLRMPFIEKAKKVHGNKYVYDITKYVDCKTHVQIKCPEHGVFTQNPNTHLAGYGCRKCTSKQRTETQSWSRQLNTEKFIERAMEVHGTKYDYSKVDYKGSKKKVIISCKKHGEFQQAPQRHLVRRNACPKCSALVSGKKSRLTQKQFLFRALAVHGNRYDYTKSVYITNLVPITITCRKHGDFEQRPISHLAGRGCRMCKYEITRSNGEAYVEQALKELHVNYTPQYRFDDCVYKYRLEFDFKVTYRKRIGLIEFDGLQHYRVVDLYGGKAAHEENKKRDRIKNRYAKKNGYPLLRIVDFAHRDPVKKYKKIKRMIREWLRSSF